MNPDRRAEISLFSPLRILHVLPYFSPGMGGVARVVYQLATHLSRRGHKVTVVAGDYRYREASFSGNDFELVLFRSTISQVGFYFTPRLIAWARGHVAQFDVIHLHEVRTFQNAVVRQFAVRYKVPYVLSAHGTLPIILQRKFAKRAYDLVFGQQLIKGASRLIAVSALEAEQYHQAGVDGQRVRVIYNGLDPSEFANMPPRGMFRKTQRVSDDTSIILFLGRLHKIKGIECLVKAFAQSQPYLNQPLLIVAGPDHGEQGHLKALADHLGLKDQVRFVGPLYGHEKLTAYVDADVLVSPSIYEIFGLVPFEALMCGTPVIVADGFGAAQLLHDAGAGSVVPHGDINALSNALVQSIQQGKRETLDAARKFIAEQLAWDRLVEDFESLYHSVASQGRLAC